MKASVLGAGSFGTAIASVLANNADQVVLWGRDEKQVQQINQDRENKAYLPGLKLPEKVSASHSLEEATKGAELIVTATPSHATRELLAKVGPMLPKGAPVVTVAKGIENETLLTMTEVHEQCLPEEFHPYIAVLSVNFIGDGLRDALDPRLKL